MSLITESDLIKRDTIAVCQYLSKFNEFLNSEIEDSLPCTPSLRFFFSVPFSKYLGMSQEDWINYILLILASECYHIHYSPELNKLLLEPPPYDSLSKLIAQGITSSNPDPSVTYSNSTNKYR